MEKTLVVVESPAKAKTIKKYLGSGFEVKASVGHVKDLPQKSLGVRVQDGFAPEYQVIEGKEKVLRDLNEAARKAAKIYLATDPDREGEAIAWHLRDELDVPKETIYRVLFNELTEKTIKEAISKPSRLDENKYNAQQARRILDRIVGYELSPLLWDKVQFGLSAGRVQSVALRLIVDRSHDIDVFVPEESWSIDAALTGKKPPIFEAALIAKNGTKLKIDRISQARELVAEAQGATFEVTDVVRKERAHKPPPPFITSTLQQEASRKLRLTGSRTMRIAQQLYEGIEIGAQGSVGLITYMRTDSPRLAPEATAMAREYLRETFGPEFVPAKPHFFKGRKTAQEAHEAIRPTSLEHTPEKLAKYLDKSQAALYRLIWNRFLASQAAAAVYDSTRADIAAGRLTFRVTGSSLKFEGYLRIYGAVADEEDAESDGDEDKDRLLPPLAKGDTLELQKLIPRQRFSRAPAPYNEASLIKELEERGIGRPSTYAETVSTIQRRKYVQLKEKKFEPTLLGKIIARLLVKSFPDLLNAQFTADMESSLDRIEEGSASLTQTLTTFYEPFHTALVDAKRTMKNIRREGLPVAEYCPDCGKPVLLRAGRFGLFYGCSAYPVCAYTRNIAQEGERPEPVPTEHKCPQCDSVMMLVQGKAGPFLSCSRYPECKTAKPLTTGIICPECKEGEMAQRKTKRGKNFYSCVRFPACNFSMWYKPVKAKCPNPLCDSEVMEEHVTKRFGVTLHCPKCKSKHKESA